MNTNTNANKMINQIKNNDEKVVNNMSNVNKLNEVQLNNINKMDSEAARGFFKTQQAMGYTAPETNKSQADLLDDFFSAENNLGMTGRGLPVGTYKVTVCEKVTYDTEKRPVLMLITEDGIKVKYTIYDYDKFSREFFAQTGKLCPPVGMLENNSFILHAEETSQGNTRLRMNRTLPTVGEYMALVKSINIFKPQSMIIIEWVIDGKSYFEFQKLTADNKAVVANRMVAIAGAMGMPDHQVVNGARFLNETPGKFGVVYCVAQFYSTGKCITRRLQMSVWGETLEQIQNPEKTEAALAFQVKEAWAKAKGQTIEKEDTAEVIEEEVPRY